MFERLKPVKDLPDPARVDTIVNGLTFTFSAMSGLGGLVAVVTWFGYQIA